MIGHPFIYSDGHLYYRWDTRCLEVPRGLSEKASLLSWYADKLEFPKHFGMNWEAFGECMRDLSWFHTRRLSIFHPEVPLEGNFADQETYLNVLAEIVRSWKPGAAHEVVAVFDPACAPQVQRGEPMASYDREMASGLAKQILAEISTPDLECVIVKDETVETEKGWLFFYQNKEFLETGNPTSRLAGNGPILVSPEGFIRRLPTAIPWQEAIKRIK